LETRNQKKFYGLDHLRSLAIFIVFLYHYYLLIDGGHAWLPKIARFGWTGVDLFFVLSGFLISSQLFSQLREQQKISYYEFFIKRSFRIQPAFWFTVALYFCFPFFREEEGLPPLWKLLTFTQNLGLDASRDGAFSHAWSLCVEEHFYFFIPLILILLQSLRITKKSYWLILALFLFSFTIRIFSYYHFFIPKIGEENSLMYWYKYVYYPTYNRLDGLLVGVAIAFIYQFYPDFWDRISKYGNYFFIISLFILLASYFLFQDQFSIYTAIFGFPLIAAGYGMLVIGAISPSTFLYRWNSKATTFGATISYAIYLTHKGIIHITSQFLANLKIDGYLLLFICIAACTLGAVILNRVIEKPFMKLRLKFLK
jgi:peptidoglycan/LPS O-acetylase OafA/YrhL